MSLKLFSRLFLFSLQFNRIGLVLGGGGSRGIAHVGIIKAFEEAGIPFETL